MRRIVTTVFLGICALIATGPRVAGAASLFFDYVGFDYEDPNPIPATFGEAGSGYVGLGFVPGLFAPLQADTSVNQYTYRIFNLTPTSTQSFPPYIVVNYGPGTLQIWEDSKSTGTPADYGTNPPSAQAPPTFVDGNLFLEGSLTGFQFVLNTANGSGSYEGAFTVTGGQEFTNGHVPSNQTTGWTFAGSSNNALNIPPGYQHQIDGQTFLNEPVRVLQPSSWGHIKALYR
jgi:hypothetical protein